MATEQQVLQAFGDQAELARASYGGDFSRAASTFALYEAVASRLGARILTLRCTRLISEREVRIGASTYAWTDDRRDGR